MGENYRRFKEKMRGASFRKQVVDPYVEQMDLKQTVEMQKTIEHCDGKGMAVMIVAYLVGGIIASVIGGWIWIMDYLGYFPYVTGDVDPFFGVMLTLVPVSVYFGYVCALDDFKNSLRKRIKKIAGVEDGEEEKIAD